MRDNIKQFLLFVVAAFVGLPIVFLGVFFTNPSLLAIKEEKLSPRAHNEFTFYSRSPKAFDFVAVFGSSCDDLKGSAFTLSSGSRHVEFLDGLRWMRDWRAPMRGELALMEKLRDEAYTTPKGRFLCLPPQTDIASKMKSGVFDYGRFPTIKLADGGIIRFHSSKSVSTKPKADFSVTDKPCLTDKKRLCKEITAKAYKSALYVPVCWRCGTMPTGGDMLDHALYFSADHEETFIIGFNGGALVPLRSYLSNDYPLATEAEEYRRQSDVFLKLLDEKK